VSLVKVDVFRSSTDLPLAERIGSLGEQINALIVEYKPQVIAIERVYADVNVRSVMGTAQISGVAMMLAYQHRIPVVLHTPTEVKAAVTGSGRANKAQVGRMVAKILDLDEIPKPADAADSLAIAICHGWRSFGANVPLGTGITDAQRAWHAAERAASANVER